MSDSSPRLSRDRSFLWFLGPLALASLPSLLFCAMEVSLAVYGTHGRTGIVFHWPPQTAWDRMLLLQSTLYGWVARWNAVVTLAATALLVATLLLQRWRHWLGLVTIPYGLLLCADFTLRWRSALLP